jgi:hypothetical protein
MIGVSRFIVAIVILTSSAAAQTDSTFTNQNEFPESGVEAGSLIASSAQGGDFDLCWYTFDGGGAMCTTGEYFELSGTIGQPDAGPVSAGGDFTLTGGFWAVAGSAGESCPADFDDDGDVDTADLLHLLGCWATGCGDVDGDGDTDTADLLALLGAWGECP